MIWNTTIQIERFCTKEEDVDEQEAKGDNEEEVMKGEDEREVDGIEIGEVKKMKGILKLTNKKK